MRPGSCYRTSLPNTNLQRGGLEGTALQKPLSSAQRGGLEGTALQNLFLLRKGEVWREPPSKNLFLLRKGEVWRDRPPKSLFLPNPMFYTRTQVGIRGNIVNTIDETIAAGPFRAA